MWPNSVLQCKIHLLDESDRTAFCSTTLSCWLKVANWQYASLSCRMNVLLTDLVLVHVANFCCGLNVAKCLPAGKFAKIIESGQVLF